MHVWGHIKSMLHYGLDVYKRQKYDYTYFLSGCVNNSEKINLADILDLSPSNILSIKISKSGGPQTIIENAEQIEEICSFLSSAFTLGNKYTELNLSLIHI